MTLPAQLLAIPGSQHWESVIAAGLRWPDAHAGPLHGSPARWDWGVTVRTLAEACQRHAKLVAYAAELTEGQRRAVFSDPSDEAAAIRKAMR
jgi:hypothetical protein